MLFTYYNCFTLLFIKWSVVLACSEVCTFFVHAECIPCCRTRESFLRNSVHGYRDSQHRAHCNQVCTDVSVGDRTVVSTPVVHYIVSCLERSLFAIASWSEPCTWPCVVCTFPELVRYFFRNAVHCRGICPGERQFPGYRHRGLAGGLCSASAENYPQRRGGECQCVRYISVSWF